MRAKRFSGILTVAGLGLTACLAWAAGHAPAANDGPPTGQKLTGDQGPTAQAAAEDPLGDISLDMQLAVGDLTKLSTGEMTQETQAAVVSKLDDLIARLEKECEACKGSGSGANPSRPLADSMIMGGPGGSGEMHGAKREGKDWGELPAKERDRILQSMTEGFPSHYQEILKRYYRRLAEETPAADSDAGQPKDAAAEGADTEGSSTEGSGTESAANADSSPANPADESVDSEPSPE